MNIEKLADKCRELRENIGMTQEDLAKNIGVSSSMISKWERGKIHLSLERIMQVLNALGYEVELTQKNTTLTCA